MILGIRCSNSDYTFALLKGRKHAPQLHNVKSASFPKGYTRPNALRWFFQEIEDYFAKHTGIAECIIKGAEPMAQKGSTYSERVEHESMVLLTAAIKGINASRKVKATIAKNLGLTGRAKALEEDLDSSVLADYNKCSAKEQEAILAAWSGLKS